MKYYLFKNEYHFLKMLLLQIVFLPQVFLLPLHKYFYHIRKIQEENYIILDMHLYSLK